MLERLKSLFGRKAPAPTEPVVPSAPAGADTYEVYCTLRDVPVPTFAHTLHAHLDLSEPAMMEQLKQACAEILSRGDGKMNRDKFEAMLHIQRAQHYVRLAVGPDAIAAMHDWAGDANGVLRTPAGDVTDTNGNALIMAAAGVKETDARFPVLPEAITRMRATQTLLAARGIDASGHLPSLVCEREVMLRTRDEAVERARALLLVALRADSVASGEPVPLDALLSKMPLADDALSPQEQAFLQQEAPSNEACAPFIWRYESLLVLEWALGLVDQLPYPDAGADSAKVVATLIEMRGPQLRPAAEILDALDLHYRLHWHIRQTRIKQGVEADGVDADVVMERHRTLNWLVRFLHEDWDDVDTPT